MNLIAFLAAAVILSAANDGSSRTSVAVQYASYDRFGNVFSLSVTSGSPFYGRDSFYYRDRVYYRCFPVGHPLYRPYWHRGSAVFLCEPIWVYDPYDPFYDPYYDAGYDPYYDGYDTYYDYDPYFDPYYDGYDPYFDPYFASYDPVYDRRISDVRIDLLVASVSKPCFVQRPQRHVVVFDGYRRHSKWHDDWDDDRGGRAGRSAELWASIDRDRESRLPSFDSSEVRMTTAALSKQGPVATGRFRDRSIEAASLAFERGERNRAQSISEKDVRARARVSKASSDKARTVSQTKGYVSSRERSALIRDLRVEARPASGSTNARRDQDARSLAAKKQSTMNRLTAQPRPKMVTGRDADRRTTTSPKQRTVRPGGANSREVAARTRSVESNSRQPRTVTRDSRARLQRIDPRSRSRQESGQITRSVTRPSTVNRRQIQRPTTDSRAKRSSSQQRRSVSPGPRNGGSQKATERVRSSNGKRQTDRRERGGKKNG
jgi:hypothetical protein